MKTIFIFWVILFLPSIFFAQAENKQLQWTIIESPKGELSKMNKGLVINSVDAARRIKFLPAEVDGKPVDVTKIVEYSFSIY